MFNIIGFIIAMLCAKCTITPTSWVTQDDIGSFTVGCGDEDGNDIECVTTGSQR